MNKKVKKIIIVAVSVVAAGGLLWGGLTVAKNARRGDVNVYAVNDFAMTNYWGDTSNTSGQVTTDKLQKVYISSSQTVNRVAVKEGDTVKKGAVLLTYDSTLTQAAVEQAQIAYERQEDSLTNAKNELEVMKKAKNKETLEKEKAKLQAELDAEIDKINKDNNYDPKSPAVLGLIPVEGATGNDPAHPLYCQVLEADTLLSEAKLRAILHGSGSQPGLSRAVPTAEEGKGQIKTYVVLVTRDKDLKGGVPASQGYLLVEDYVPAVTDENGIELTPATTAISFQLCDLAAYVDPGQKYDTDNYRRIQQKLGVVQYYLDYAMEQKDLAKAILDKEQEIKELEVNQKLAKLELQKKKNELGDGNVYAEFDGTVKVVRDAAEAYNNSEAVVELSGGGGYYITGTLSEMDLGSVKVGDTVSVSSWMTGAACEGTIVSIDEYPTNRGNNWGDGNSNVSYYPFKVFVEEDANLQPDDYVEIQYQKDAAANESGNTLYLQSWFIRTDNGKSYVMVRGEDGKLEQRWVQTGRDLWGSYTQIRGGLTVDDYVAFPYGRDVVEGARTVEATADQLYNYGV